MAYIGYQPSQLATAPFAVNTFTGDGSTTTFTLSQSVPGGNEAMIEVVLENVIQSPIDAYTVGGATNTSLVFSEAPISGGVIYVIHKGEGTYNLQPSSGSVTSSTLDPVLRNFTVDTYTGNASTTTFTLTDTPYSANSIIVTVDGIVQTATTNYTVSGTTLSFGTEAPASGAKITVVHMGFSTGNKSVADGTITTVKLNSAGIAPIITGGTINGAVIGGTTAAAGSFTTINASTSITNAGLTSGRVTYAGASGLLSDSANLTFDGATLTTSNGSGAAGLIVNSSANTPYLRFDQSNAAKFTIGESSIVGGGAGFYDFYAVASVGQRFWTGATQRMTITSAGLVGIGTSSPSSLLTLGGVAATGYTSLLANGTTTAYNLWTLNNTGGDLRIGIESATAVGILTGSSNYSACIGTLTANNLHLGTNSTVRATIDSSGNLIVGATSTVGTGAKFQVTSSLDTSIFKCTSSTTYAAIVSNVENISARLMAFQYGSGVSPTNVASITTNGTSIALNNVAGITFPGTQVASADANTLDDYEEGTWTPTIAVGSGSLTYSAQFGQYTKIGNVVTIAIDIRFTASVSGAQIQNITLPFTAAYSTSSRFPAFAVGAHYYVNIGSGTTVECYTSNGQTTGNFHSSGNNTNQLPIYTTAVEMTFRIIGSYLTS